MTAAEPLNPYIAGNPVSGQEMFFGRADVFQWIEGALVGRHRDNVIVLYGQQRTGKTSTLYQMKRRLNARYVSIFIDLHGLALDSFEGFVWELTNHIARSMAHDYGVGVPGVALEKSQEAARHAFEEEFLANVWLALGDRHVLLMLDEAIRLQEQVKAGKLPTEIFEYLRHLMQHHERLNFLFALGSGLEEMEREYSFLFSGALYKRISFLDHAATMELITTPVQSYYRVDKSAQERIYALTSGHPYFTQLLCHSLCDRWRRTRQAVVAEVDVEDVMDEVVERGLAVLKHMWEDGAPVEQAVLASIAAGMQRTNKPLRIAEIEKTWSARSDTVPPLAASRAVERLVGREVLRGSNRYSFSVDLQRRWIARERPLSRVREEVGPLLDASKDSRLLERPLLPPFALPLFVLALAASIAAQMSIDNVLALQVIRVLTLLGTTAAVLIGVTHLISRSLAMSQTRGSQYRAQVRVSTVLSPFVTLLWYAGVSWPAGHDPTLPLGSVALNQFFELMVVTQLLNLLVVFVTLSVTWNVGVLSRRTLGTYSLGAYTAACVLLAGTIVSTTALWNAIWPKFIYLE